MNTKKEFIIDKKRKIKIAFHTLGCKLNFSETSSISRTFSKDKYTIVSFNSKADVYVINTCSVTENADKKTKSLIKLILRKNINGFIAIIGCYAQLKTKEISQIQGVDLVIGAKEKFRLAKYVNDAFKDNLDKINSCDISKVNFFNEAYSLGENRTRAFLKVQDGCDYKCSYCTIPLARGVSRSDSIENIILNIHKIAKEGIKEVVITGVNTGDYGKRIDSNKNNFLQLICELDKIKPISRFRISSIEPNLLDDKIIEFVSKSKKFVPHFHIPLQSGSDKILKKMKRRYDLKLYKNKILKLKKMFPDLCIGADVIVGFPGETDEDFNETYNFIKKMDISYLHVFTYSRRENTKADKFSNQINDKIKKARRIVMQKLSEHKFKNFVNKNINDVREVLFENYESGLLSGLSDNYMKVFVPGNEKYVNTIQKVRISNNDKFIFGEIVND